MLVKGGIEGEKGNLGMKYAMRIHLRAVALEVLFQFQGDALHLLSPRTASTHLLPAACQEQQGCPLSLGIPCGHRGSREVGTRRLKVTETWDSPSGQVPRLGVQPHPREWA